MPVFMQFTHYFILLTQNFDTSQSVTIWRAPPILKDVLVLKPSNFDLLKTTKGSVISLVDLETSTFAKFINTFSRSSDPLRAGNSCYSALESV